MTLEPTKPAVCASIAIFAWNEQDAISRTLESLFAQSLFARFEEHKTAAEVICVLNGCTDGTAAVARRTCARVVEQHAARAAIVWRVADIPDRGKLNAWNVFVHSLAAREARTLVMMDADILIHKPETLWNLWLTLETDPEAKVAVDRPCKDITFRSRRSVTDRLALASSEMTGAAEAQLCAQLYAIRAQTARGIYLPKDLFACEDGFIKALVCTDNLRHEVWPQRIRLAPEAEHIFQAYTSPAAILRNQKRQVIGQTLVHILLDEFLPRLSEAERADLATTLRRLDEKDPTWLKRLIQAHLGKAGYCWRLYPGLVGQRFLHLRNLRGWRKLKCYPAALASSAATVLASWMAYRSLKRGATQYWPKADRFGPGVLPSRSPSQLGVGLNLS